MADVFVTGASGFVGRSLVDVLLSKGHRVWGLTRGVREEVRDGVQWLTGSLTDPSGFRDVLSRVDAVIHLAAVLSARRASEFHRVNATGTEVLLDACLPYAHRLRRVVVMSSVAAMGPRHDGKRLSETDACHPTTAYGRSKFEGERAALAYADRLRICVIRPSFVYGRGDGRGADHLRSLLLAPGRAWRTSIAEFSLVHVVDLAEMCAKAMEWDGPSGEVFLAALPGACSWEDVREAIIDAADVHSGSSQTHRSAALLVAQRIGELTFVFQGAQRDYWGCETSKARRELDFRGRVTLKVGVRDTVRSYLESGLLAPHMWSKPATTQV